MGPPGEGELRLLAAPLEKLDVAGGEKQGVAAELEGADLEADPGAGGALGEDHSQRLGLMRPGREQQLYAPGYSP